jgi:hypothetical protein
MLHHSNSLIRSDHRGSSSSELEVKAMPDAFRSLPSDLLPINSVAERFGITDEFDEGASLAWGRRS